MLSAWKGHRGAGISGDTALKYFLWALLHINLAVVQSQYGIC